MGQDVQADVCMQGHQTKVSGGPPACASCLERSPAAAWDVSIGIKGRERCRMKVGLNEVGRFASNTMKRRAAWGRITTCPLLSPRASSFHLLHPDTGVTFSPGSLVSRLYLMQTGSSVPGGGNQPLINVSRGDLPPARGCFTSVMLILICLSVLGL